jgi:hypothetical protein
MTVAQHDMTVQSIAVSQMRSILMTGTTPTGADVCVTAPSVQLPGSESATNVVVKGCGLAAMTISGIKIDGASLAAQTINAARPRIFEIGSGDSLVRVGGKINEDI